MEKSDGLKRRTYHFPYIATYRLYRRKTGSLERKAKDIYLKKLWRDGHCWCPCVSSHISWKHALDTQEIIIIILLLFLLLLLLLLMSSSPVTGISSRYFSWTSGDPHRSRFKLHTAVLSVLCDVPSIAVFVVNLSNVFPVQFPNFSLSFSLLLLLLLSLLLLYDMDVSCHRPFLPGTSLEPAVIPTAQAWSFTLQYFPYCVWCSYYYYYYYHYYYLVYSYSLFRTKRSTRC